MTERTIKSYEAELALLDKTVAKMGGLAEHILGMAFDSLERRDPTLAQQAIAVDIGLDKLERDIEEQAIDMIARRQPVANDLRHIMAGLKISHELERIGDLAKNIGKRAVAIGAEPYPRLLASGLRHMADQASQQLKDVLDAYAERNAEIALRVWHADAKIDGIYNSVFRELLTYMMEDPRNIGPCTHLLFGAKNIERIGDHTTNIAETVHFLVKGDVIAEDRPKSDVTSSTLIERMT